VLARVPGTSRIKTLPVRQKHSSLEGAIEMLWQHFAREWLLYATTVMLTHVIVAVFPRCAFRFISFHFVPCHVSCCRDGRSQRSRTNANKRQRAGTSLSSQHLQHSRHQQLSIDLDLGAASRGHNSSATAHEVINCDSLVFDSILSQRCDVRTK